MVPAARGRGRPPLAARGARGRGRPPRRGRGRGRWAGRGVTNVIQIEVPQGDEIVSSIEQYALAAQVPILNIRGATGMVSEAALDGRAMLNNGSYQIEDLRGVWSEFQANGENFFVTISLRDLNSGQHIFGNSRFLLAANIITVSIQT